MTNILALIPARSGSKSIPGKNIRPVAGKPLIAWSIEHAKAARRVSRIVVSTDSEEYATLARAYGADAPFLRPPEISGDTATDLEAFVHALAWLKEHENYVPDICVHLRPTYPVRRPGIIDECIRILDEDVGVDSVRTVTEVLHPPFKMWYRAEDGLLTPLLKLDGVDEPWNEPRQRLPKTYIQTANVDVVRTAVIVEQHSMTGKRIHGYVEPDFHDVDTQAEMDRVAGLLAGSKAGKSAAVESHRSGGGTAKIFCFDIDGVIAELTPDNNYRDAKPRREIVETINRLHDAGHRIILHTARGFVTGIDWAEVTREQMTRWGVKYDELHFGKPAADYYIDDRMLSLEDVQRLQAHASEAGDFSKREREPRINAEERG